MTHEEQRAAALDIAYLASCAVDGVAPDAARGSATELSALYQAAERESVEPRA